MQSHQQEQSVGEELPLPVLEEQVIALAGDLAAAEARWLHLVAEFDRREGWVGVGVKSCAHWLSGRCGLGLTAAREKVRVARALSALPQVAVAFERGELSYCRTRAITRVANPSNEEQLLELARHSTGAELDRLVRATLAVKSPDAVAERASHRSVTWHWEDDGCLALRARLDPVEGARLLAALEAAQAAQAADLEADRRENADGGSAEVQRIPIERPPGRDAAGRTETGAVASSEADAVTAAAVTAGGDHVLGVGWGGEDLGAKRSAAVAAKREQSAGVLLAGEEVAAEQSDGRAAGPEARLGDNDAPEAAAAAAWGQRADSRADALVAIAAAYLDSQASESGVDLRPMAVQVQDGVPPQRDPGPAVAVEPATRLAHDDLGLPGAQAGREAGDRLVPKNLSRRTAEPAASRRRLSRFRLRSTARDGRPSHRAYGRGRSEYSGEPGPGLPAPSWAEPRGPVPEPMNTDGQLVIIHSAGSPVSEMSEPTRSTRGRRDRHRRAVAGSAVDIRSTADALASGALIGAVAQAEVGPFTSAERLPSRHEVSGSGPSGAPPLE